MPAPKSRIEYISTPILDPNQWRDRKYQGNLVTIDRAEDLRRRERRQNAG